jgi:diaminobutyrate-2-oxoglutarate transaminase
VAAEAFRRKVVIETSGPNAEVLKLMPPLTIERDLLEDGLRRLAGAIATVLEQDQLRPAA